MNMQDKDLDQLFRSKLVSMEAEPSGRVWANISSELGKPKQRKSIIPLLRVAASVAILISAGLFFLPKKQAITNKPKNRLAANQPVKTTVTMLPANLPQQTNVSAQVQPVSVSKQHQTLVVTRHTTVQPLTAQAEQPVATDPAQTINPVNNQQQVLATAGSISINKPVVPDNTISLSIKTSDTTPDIITKPAVTLAAIPDKDISQPTAKKHKIRGLGSFINAVVGVVDKRQDKIIEFTDTDEGNTVTGLNLGIIAIKKNQ